MGILEERIMALRALREALQNFDLSLSMKDKGTKEYGQLLGAFDAMWTSSPENLIVLTRTFQQALSALIMKNPGLKNEVYKALKANLDVLWSLLAS